MCRLEMPCQQRAPVGMMKKGVRGRRPECEIVLNRSGIHRGDAATPAHKEFSAVFLSVPFLVRQVARRRVFRHRMIQLNYEWHAV